LLSFNADMAESSTQERKPSAQQLKKLLKVYAADLRSRPDDLHLRMKIAEVLRLLGRKEEAVSVYGAIVYVCCRNGHLGQAISICKIILEVDPDHVETQTMLAKLFTSQRVRGQKQSVVVQKVGDRWIADPTQGGARKALEEIRGDGDAPLYAATGPQPRPPHAPTDAGSRVEQSLPVDRRGVETAVGRRGSRLQQAPPTSSSDLPSAVKGYAEKRPTKDVPVTSSPAILSETLADVVESIQEPPGGAAKRRSTEDSFPPPFEAASGTPPALRSPFPPARLPRKRPTLRGFISSAGEPEDPSPPGTGEQRSTNRYQVGQMEALLGLDLEDSLKEPTKREKLKIPQKQEIPPVREMPISRGNVLSERNAGLEAVVTAAEAEPRHEPTQGTGPIARPIGATALRDEREAQGVRPYRSVQREIDEAGSAQEDIALGAEEQAEAERSLQDTLRDPTWDARSEGSDPALRRPFPLFSDLDFPAFLAMINGLQRRHHPAGDLVLREGDPGESLFLVSSGHLLVYKCGSEGEKVELGRLSSGAFFGEFGLLTDKRRHASVECIDDCELLELQRGVLFDLIERHPSIAWTLRLFYQQRVMTMVVKTSRLFQAVQPIERRTVLDRFAMRRYLEGEWIIRQGEKAAGFFVILVGEVVVTCAGPGGTDVEVGRLAEGEYFGEMSLLSGQSAEATVRAATVTELLLLEAREFYDLASAHPEIWVEVQAEAERRYRRTQDVFGVAEDRHVATGDLVLI
jgi:cAMP-dependent protein kinase regulator